MKISIFAGDIVDVQADALCTSTNPRLSLVMGTGAAVRGRGGSAILRACEAIVAAEGLLPAGAARATTAGSLPHKAIIHCVASDVHHHSWEAVVMACVRNALRCAEVAGCTSIAMPVFATGHAHLNFRAAAGAMATVLRVTQTRIVSVVLAVPDREQAAVAQAEVARITGGNVPLTLSPRADRAPSWLSRDDDRFL